MDGLPIPALEVDRRGKSATVGTLRPLDGVDGWVGCWWVATGGPAAERTDGVNLPPNMQTSARC